MDCCNPNGLNQMFTGRLVRQELNAFRRGGLNRRQQAIVSELEPLISDTSVLDIGCGLGAIGTSLLKKGGSNGTFVDISADYLKAAREVAADAGVGERASFFQEDFATSARPFPKVDVVVLDRVVCCYPNATARLAKAAQHSQQVLVFTFPRPFWFMPLFRSLFALEIRHMRREYRFFLHDPESLVRAATGAGHAHVATRSVGMWQLMVVRKRPVE